MMKNHDDQIIDLALNILITRLRQPGAALTNTADAKKYLTLKLGQLQHEVFVVVFLDSAHRVIEVEEMFRGTIDGASVYPRDVAKAVLMNDAAAVIFAHNHPSGGTEPSDADRAITRRLIDALGLFDVRVLDHIIVGGNDTTSFADRGLL